MPKDLSVRTTRFFKSIGKDGKAVEGFLIVDRMG